MNTFTRRSENVIDERRNRQPTYLTGLMVSARDVVQESLKNPWFLSTRQMSPIFGDKAALISDWNKDGISVVGPDYERPESRKPWTYVGVLIPGVQGTDSGKVEAFSTQNVHNYVHMMAGRKETPTGIRVEQRRASGTLDTNTENSGMDSARNTPPQQPAPESKDQSSGATAANVVTKVETQNGVTKTVTTVKRPPSLIPPNSATIDIDEKGRRVPTLATSTGSLGGRIQTGTTMIAPSTLMSKVGLRWKGVR